MVIMIILFLPKVYNTKILIPLWKIPECYPFYSCYDGKIMQDGHPFHAEENLSSIIHTNQMAHHWDPRFT